jgi:hypothetical protein
MANDVKAAMFNVAPTRRKIGGHDVKVEFERGGARVFELRGEIKPASVADPV